MKIQEQHQVAGELGFEPRLTESESATPRAFSTTWLQNGANADAAESIACAGIVKRARRRLLALARCEADRGLRQRIRTLARSLYQYGHHPDQPGLRQQIAVNERSVRERRDEIGRTA